MSQNVKLAMGAIEHYLARHHTDEQKLDALRELILLEAEHQHVDIDTDAPVIARGHAGDHDIEPNAFVYYRNDPAEGKPLSLNYMKAPAHHGDAPTESRIVPESSP